MRPTIERYTADRGSLNRSSPIDYSPAHNAEMKQFYSEWLSRLSAVNFDAMGQDGRVDYLLFKNQLSYQLRQLDIETKNL
jgi:exonuclease III